MASILVSVGEASSDRQAAGVIRALNGEHQLFGKVGDHLADLGVEPVVGLRGQIGLSSPLRMLRELREDRRRLLAEVDARGTKVALLVDYSGFHLPLGRALRSRGVKVIGFIPPKLWAWGGWRLKKARAAYDELFTILPFEADWWQARKVPAAYVGNPIADECPAVESDPEGPVALLPGSRASELEHVGPLLAQSARHMLTMDADVQFNVAVAPTLDRSAVEATFAGLPVTYVERLRDAVSGASAALVCMGTAGLETALIGTPNVLTYRAAPVTWFIGNLLVRLDQTSPSNLVLDPGPWPEIMGRDADPETLARTVMALRDPHAPERIEQLEASQELRAKMAGGIGIEAVARALEVL
jgi:lipid-A-disaccharide synthase